MNSDMQSQAPKKKKHTAAKAIIFILIFALMFGAARIAFSFSFPLKADVSVESPTSSTTGVWKTFDFSVSSNQVIKEVSYALNPESKNYKPNEYSVLSTTGSAFQKNASIENLICPVGASSLMIHIETMFGTAEYEIKLNVSLGYTAAPNPEAMIELSDGNYLISDELLILFGDKVSSSDATKLVKAYGGEVIGQIYSLNQYQVRFAESGISFIQQTMQRIAEESIVDGVYLNTSMSLEIGVFPNDYADAWDVARPGGTNWGLECIDAPGAWEYNDRMKVTGVGVLDSSLQYTHEDLRINPSRVGILPTSDFKTAKELEDYFNANNDHRHSWFDGECVTCDQKDHGTHVAGIIGATANNGKGICGVNWNADISFMPLWYYTKNGNDLYMRDTTQTLLYGLSYLVCSDCRVINMSFGTSFADGSRGLSEDEIALYRLIEQSDADLIDATVKKLENGGRDFLIVKAAGNENEDALQPDDPYSMNRVLLKGESTAKHLITVGAIENTSSGKGSGKDNIRYNLASYTNYGSAVDIVAPGTDIYSTVRGDRYESMSGTSMAAPMVSGVASLLYSLDPSLTYGQVKEAILNSPKDFTAKLGKLYGIVNAKNAVDYVLKNGSYVTPPEQDKIGFVSGSVYDARSNDLIPDVTIRIVGEDGSVYFASPISDEDVGGYYVYLMPGFYDMEFSKDGYITETVHHIEIIEGQTTYNVRLNMVEEEPMPGTVAGRIVDAFDASSIKNATIRFYKGINCTTGEVIATIVSDSLGEYKLELEPGNYTMAVEADGYTNGVASVLVISDRYMSSQDCTLTPILENGEIRIVLTWGRYPEDLDSHLIGPTPDGDRFHVFYSDKNYYYRDTCYDNLDVDDTTSYGPETTSVYHKVDGTYTFYVHNYTDRNSSNSNSMALSDAKVTVYLPGLEQPKVFYVPNEAGTLWKVFSVTNGVLTPINEMSYESNEDMIGYDVEVN